MEKYKEEEKVITALRKEIEEERTKKRQQTQIYSFFLQLAGVGAEGPPGGRNFARPPNRQPSPLFDKGPIPPTEFCPETFSEIYLFFLSILTISSSTLHQKVLF